MTSIAVIGAGITGVTTAYKLLALGFDVTVFDRQAHAAMETSFANGGQLSASNAEVWNHPSTFLKGIKWMLRKDAPLLVHPSPTWHKLSWMAEFVLAARSLRGEHHRHDADGDRRARASVGMAEREGIEFDLEMRGILHVYETPAEMAQGRQGQRLAGKRRPRAAAPYRPTEIAAIEPTHRGTFVGGFFTESDFTGDIHKYTRQPRRCVPAEGRRLRNIRRRCRASSTTRGAAASTWPGTTAGGRGQRDERFDAIVVCAGVASREFAAQLGDRVNIYPVKGYSVTVNLDRRGEPRCRALGQPSRRQGQDRDEPTRRGPPAHRRHGGVRRREPRHQARRASGRWSNGAARASRASRRDRSCPGPACAR